jgi:hypothetical protein
MVIYVLMNALALAGDRTPVIIPAYNEESDLYVTLRTLPAELVYPIVAVNGSNDGTAQVARDFGAMVLEREEQGKLPAIQATLKTLGGNALQPLMILDADTRPIMPRRWHRGFLRILEQDEDDLSIGVSGPLLYTNRGIVDNASITLLSAFRSTRFSPNGKAHKAGPNIGLHLKNESVLQALLDMRHWWPGEDRAMLDEVLKHGGRLYKPLSPGMYTKTAIPEGTRTTVERIRYGRAKSRAMIITAYADRGPDGSIPYTPNA